MKTLCSLPALLLFVAAGCGDTTTSSDMGQTVITPTDFALICVNKGEVICGNECHDTSKDFYHCGGCNKPCMPGYECSGGQCTVVCVNFAKCGNSCFDTKHDPAHCGDCNKACAVNEVCVDSKCVLCPPGGTVCGGKCVDPTNDNQNCGGCGTACNVAVETCSGGKCVIFPCGPGQQRCAGACTNTQTDDANCGSCGAACANGSRCVAGACQPSCPQGQTYCAMSKVCSILPMDRENCGACGKSCPPGYSCVSSTCVCPPNLKDCGGTCLDINNDASNCGNCGTVCPMGQACQFGKCTTPSCKPSGLRVPFTSFTPATTGCVMFNVCASDNYAPQTATVFQQVGESITCGFAGVSCIGNVGITTDMNSTTCQGKWDVLCDGVNIGSINSIGLSCAGSAMASSCRLSFPPRPCAVIKVMAAVGKGPSLCCDNLKPVDSAIRNVSAW